MVRAAASRRDGNYDILSLRTEMILFISFAKRLLPCIRNSMSWDSTRQNMLMQTTAIREQLCWKNETTCNCLGFTIAGLHAGHKSNENTSEASYQVAVLSAKPGKPLTEGEFIKDCVRKMVENICLGKKQEFAIVSLAHKEWQLLCHWK